MNFTKMLHDDFSDILPQCFQFVGFQVVDYCDQLYTDMGRDFTELLVSFLFTQMGNANRFRTAVVNIEENDKQQLYEKNAEEYGKILNLIFLNIEPLEEATFGIDIDKFQNLEKATTEILSRVNE